MAKKSIYTVVITRVRMMGNSSTMETTGIIEELTKYFKYTLEVGKSWNSKINLCPKTIKSLVSNVNKTYEEKNNGMTYIKVKDQKS